MKMFSLICSIFLLCSGCAKMVMVPYEITSSPAGAVIEVNDIYMGEAPTTITLGVFREWGFNGWVYGYQSYSVTASPPLDSFDELYSQTKVIAPRNSKNGGKLLFNLRLKTVRPTQSIEIYNKEQ